jgi:hypothetical protein
MQWGPWPHIKYLQFQGDAAGTYLALSHTDRSEALVEWFDRSPLEHKEAQMTALIRSIVVAGVFVVLVGVHTASAQIAGPVEFTTAFPFTVGNATVPAGSYTISPDFDNGQIFELTGSNTGVFFQVANVETAKVPSKTEVVFKRYGQGYVLHGVWIVGSRDGVEATMAEAEKHHAKHGGPTGEERVEAHKKVQTSERR